MASMQDEVAAAVYACRLHVVAGQHKIHVLEKSEALIEGRGSICSSSCRRGEIESRSCLISTGSICQDADGEKVIVI